MSQSPVEIGDFHFESSYADAARQLNKLVRAGKSYSGHERNCCYLNVHGKRFANASIVSGFDFPEDGRAVAITDWDGDGDQDFWVACRTAPQLRLMQNQLNSEKNWVRFELQGTSSNRDAIGARVIVKLTNGQTLERTLRCGEGFLSCQSKRLHFGLGDEVRVREVTVRWPNGKLEAFGPIPTANHLYRLVEGEQEMAVLQLTTAPMNATTSPELPLQKMATHNVLSSASPVPPLPFKKRNGQTVDASSDLSQPRLINLWASWCQPCKVELQEWNEAELSKQLDVLVLSVDEINDSSSSEAAMEWLRLAGYEDSSGFATAELLDALQTLHNVIYDHHRPLPVPTSILLDRDGWLRAVYKGTVSADRIEADLRAIEQGRLLDDVFPFPGKWLGRQSTHNLSKLVQELYQQGHTDAAATLVDRMEASLANDQSLMVRVVKARLFLAEQLSESNPQVALQHVGAILKLDPNQPTAHERAALILARAGQAQAAAVHFQSAIKFQEAPKARTHFNYGQLLRKAGQSSLAAKEFQRALQIDSKLADAHQQMGLLAASQQDFPGATKFFAEAVTLQPKSAMYRVNLAMAFSQQQQSESAWRTIQPILGEKDLPPMALLLAAKSLGELQRYDDAIPLLERFLVMEPNAKDVRQQLKSMRQKASEQ